MSFPSFQSQHGVDFLPQMPQDKRRGERIQYYAADEDLQNPYVSPYFGSFDGLPPLLIQVGTIEKLYDEIIATVQKVPGSVVLETYRSQVHVFQQLREITSASKVATDRAGEWMKEIWLAERQVTSKRQMHAFDFNGKLVESNLI